LSRTVAGRVTERAASSHTSVALAIAAGAHPKAIQARAGHSSITVTMNTYGHLFPGQDEALAERLDAMARGDMVDMWSTASGNVVKLEPKKASDQGK
jgi:hypothetical protein